MPEDNNQTPQSTSAEVSGGMKDGGEKAAAAAIHAVKAAQNVAAQNYVGAAVEGARAAVYVLPILACTIIFFSIFLSYWPSMMFSSVQTFWEDTAQSIEMAYYEGTDGTAGDFISGFSNVITSNADGLINFLTVFLGGGSDSADTEDGSYIVGNEDYTIYFDNDAAKTALQKELQSVQKRIEARADALQSVVESSGASASDKAQAKSYVAGLTSLTSEEKRAIRDVDYSYSVICNSYGVLSDYGAVELLCAYTVQMGYTDASGAINSDKLKIGEFLRWVGYASGLDSSKAWNGHFLPQPIIEEIQDKYFGGQSFTYQEYSNNTECYNLYHQYETGIINYFVVVSDPIVTVDMSNFTRVPVYSTTETDDYGNPVVDHYYKHYYPKVTISYGITTQNINSLAFDVIGLWDGGGIGGTSALLGAEKTRSTANSGAAFIDENSYYFGSFIGQSQLSKMITSLSHGRASTTNELLATYTPLYSNSSSFTRSTPWELDTYEDMVNGICDFMGISHSNFVGGSGAAIVQVARQEYENYPSSGQYDGANYARWFGVAPGTAWCAIFVSYCADQCGYFDSGVFPLKTASAMGMYSSFANTGFAYIASSDNVPKPGDLFFTDASGRYNTGNIHHVGIVVSYDAASNSITTIEGNYSNSVSMVTRKLSTDMLRCSNSAHGAISQSVFFVRPNYPDIGIDESNQFTVAMGIYDYFLSKGFSPAAACGVLGNVFRECSFDPNCLNSNGAYGLFQMLGSRKTAMLQFFVDNGYTQGSATGQCAYAYDELTTQTENGTSLSRAVYWRAYGSVFGITSLEEYMQIEDPVLAANVWCAVMEVPGSTASEVKSFCQGNSEDMQIRRNVAQQCYEWLYNGNPVSIGYGSQGTIGVPPL